MFKPYIVTKNGDFKICRSVFGYKQFNHGFSRFMWGTEAQSDNWSSFSQAKDRLDKLRTPPKKWVRVDSVETINAITM